MAKTLESTPVKETLAERKARKDRDRMTARIQEALRLAAEFDATLDPRQRAGIGGDPCGEKVCSE